MRRKRLKHTTFTVCRMFCGWKLFNSVAELNQLGTGVLKYDFLTQQSFFNDRLIPAPNILEEIEYFFSGELDRMSLVKSVFRLASLKVGIVQTFIESKNRKTVDIHTDKKEKPISTGFDY